MLVERIGARALSGGHPVVDVPPVFRRNGVRIDADRLDRIDVAQHVLDLRPALDLQQDLAARPHEGQRLVSLARFDCAHDVDA